MPRAWDKSPEGPEVSLWVPVRTKRVPIEEPLSQCLPEDFCQPTAHTHPVRSLCQISNYLTVPAHKLDSPTMSRARIGSGKIKEAFRLGVCASESLGIIGEDELFPS